MSEIKNVGYTQMAKCNQLTPLPFKGLNDSFDCGYSLKLGIQELFCVSVMMSTGRK